MSLVFHRSSEKKLSSFVNDFRVAAEQQGFVIHNPDSMDLARTFQQHDVAVPADFDVHMMKLCKPSKAAATLLKNPERAPLMPKYVIAFTRNNETQVRYFCLDEKLVIDLVNDPEFASSLSETQTVIRDLIDAAA